MKRTSRHLSVGCYALVSLMVYSSISRIETEYCNSPNYLAQNHLNSSLNLTAHDTKKCKLEIATSLAFWCGVFQVIYISKINLNVNV
jgi:hypothetical protein